MSRNRRFDQRFSVRSLCRYELKNSSDRGATDEEQGAAYSVNISCSGILLLVDQQPRIQQLVELRNSSDPKCKSAVLFEVRWIKPLPIASVTPRYLAGCRLVQGRIPFFLFQRRNLQGPFSGLHF